MTTKTLKQEKEAQEAADLKLGEAFLEDYKALCDEHGMMIIGKLVYTPQALGIELTVIKKPQANEINTDSGK